MWFFFLGNDDEVTHCNSCIYCSARSINPPTLEQSTQDQPSALTDQTSSVANDISTVETVATIQHPMQLLKCSLRQCKNMDAAAPQFSCGFKDCEKKIHRPCFMAFITKNGLSPLPDDKFCCGVKAHHSGVLKAVANPVNEKTRWDVDGTNGPDTEPNSMSLLLGWWSTEGNYCKYRGGKDQTGKTKEAYWQMLSQLIKDKEILLE